ncbi:MAG: tetratricopeptide repeat protein [Pseudobdellovibrionaceae bacterium]
MLEPVYHDIEKDPPALDSTLGTETHIKRRSFTTKNSKTTAQEIPTLLANAALLIFHGEIRLAQDLIREALRFDSKHVEAIRMLGTIFVKENKWAQAKHCFEQIVQIEPDDRALANLAEDCYQMGEDEKALNLYLDAMLAATYEKSSLFDIFKNIGNIHVRGGDFESAEEYYNKAFTLAPDSDVLLVNYGTLEIQKEELTRALHRFRQALDKNDKNDKAWVGLALVHHQHGDFDLSWANIEKALDANIENKTALQLMAQWSTQAGKSTSALAALDRYSEKAGFDFEISMIRASLLVIEQRWLEAQVECELMLLWDSSFESANKLLREIAAHA